MILRITKNAVLTMNFMSRTDSVATLLQLVASRIGSYKEPIPEIVREAVEDYLGWANVKEDMPTEISGMALAQFIQSNMSILLDHQFGVSPEAVGSLVEFAESVFEQYGKTTADDATLTSLDNTWLAHLLNPQALQNAPAPEPTSAGEFAEQVWLIAIEQFLKSRPRRPTGQEVDLFDVRVIVAQHMIGLSEEDRQKKWKEAALQTANTTVRAVFVDDPDIYLRLNRLINRLVAIDL